MSDQFENVVTAVDNQARADVAVVKAEVEKLVKRVEEVEAEAKAEVERLKSAAEAEFEKSKSFVEKLFAKLAHHGIHVSLS